MKKALTFLLLTILVCGSALPVAAQRSVQSGKSKRPPLHTPPLTPVSTAFLKGEALYDGSGVTLVRWQMKAEVGNVAFYVYRLDSNGKALVSDIATPGAALKAGSEPVFDERYSAVDYEGAPGAVYFIESVSLDGTTITSDPIGSVFVDDISKYETELRDRERTDLTNPLADAELNLTKELTTETEKGRLVADPDTHRWVVSQPGVKIGVEKAGLHRVSRAQLEAAGFNVNSDSTLWQLYDEGVQQSLIVGPNADYIEFLGRGVDTPESDTRAYFLIVGPNAGKRMATRVSRPSTGTVVSPAYSQTFTLKERTNYAYTIRNGDAENYWGRIVTGTQTTVNFNLSAVDLNKPNATVTVRLHGYSSGLHQTEIFLNNQQLTTPTSAGQIPFQVSQQIPTSALVDGQNSLKLRSVGPTGDFVLFDSVSVSFDRSHRALANQLFFYTLNDRQAHVTGFGSENIRLFDTTFETDPYELTNLSIQADGAGYRLNVPAQKSKVLYAVEASAVSSPVYVEAINPEMLGVPTHGADLVIIAYRTLLVEAEEWANYRRAQGTSVKVIDVDQIFEEFNYGVLKADAIKAFLSYAHTNWQNGPDYVLFIGDASFDSRNYSGTGFFNLVPARIVNTLFSETASDEFLADFNNDGLSEIAIGRIPARTPAAVALARSKVVRWEAGLNNLVARGALFAFDNPNGYDFEGMSNRLRQQLPMNVPSTMVGRPQADAQVALLAAMNTGKYVTNYSGHGSTGAWAATSFFSVFNVSCTNGQTSCVNHSNNETLFTMLTCLNGFFHNQNADSLAEALLFSSNGGAVAAWASTGETTADVQEVMGQRFYQQLGAGNILRLGDLIKDAKTQIPAGLDVRLSWALIGDPMLKVH